MKSMSYRSGPRIRNAPTLIATMMPDSTYANPRHCE